MLDFLTIFSKSGIVLWCFQSTAGLFNPAVNALIKTIIIPNKITNKPFEYDNLKLQYFLDNEFELIYVVAYQKILILNYLDKFLDELSLKFRDKYKNELKGLILNDYEFNSEFEIILKVVENEYGIDGSNQNVISGSKQMRTFQESEKSKKTVESLVENKQTKAAKVEREKKSNLGIKSKSENQQTGLELKVKTNHSICNGISKAEKYDQGKKIYINEVPLIESENDGNHSLFVNHIKISKNKELLTNKMTNDPIKKKGTIISNNKVKKKEARKWENEGTDKDLQSLDFSSPTNTSNGYKLPTDAKDPNVLMSNPFSYEKFGGKEVIGLMKGVLKDVNISSQMDYESDYELEPVQELNNINATKKREKIVQGGKLTKQSGGGLFSAFKTLIGSSNKIIDISDMEPLMEKLKQHLIAKNVASEVANQLCDSVAQNLKGKSLGTFSTLKSTVNLALEDSLVKILSPNKRIDVLRDILENRKNKLKPYVVTFCGVNGVGKSTNLAKIAFWLIENDMRVLIAACDTFRSGAVEQLRTHARHLNSLYPPSVKDDNTSFKVQLFEKGYGKDAAGLANEAISYAKENGFDVVLVDTAGRMQDNEPLMCALAKLIKVNRPDLILFVGEALVGNEAIDQLVKFNRSLANFSDDTEPRLIDGILLTKFDTIDDKVGAAISMTYISGQPILFVGTGQTYTDLKNLDTKSVIHSLMKN
ncbi:signal recognition particle receptor subunit alpha homolog isoform X2 [Gordionus sp. m RMFG-2023]|uniref:signal recognition particle receptor subunit alpha homolog isoform X2 n=1 Tax=Gordionus sp. m RMFG-2023 TaxID=3053472 RepID=UPI0031FD5DD3